MLFIPLPIPIPSFFCECGSDKMGTTGGKWVREKEEEEEEGRAISGDAFSPFLSPPPATLEERGVVI